MGAGLGAVGSIFGGISASKAMKRVKRGLEEQRKENRDWHDRRYNEDATQRADAQRILSLTEEQIRKRNRAAAGTAAVMGTGTEAAAAEKSANNMALADAAGRIEAQAEARKDRIEEQYRERDSQIDGALMNLEAQKAGNVAQAVQGVGQAAAGIAAAF